MGELKKYNVIFKGYRLEKDANGLPEYSGIYMAYRCIYKQKTNNVILNELVYIGQAENLRTRIMSHASSKDLHNGCGGDEVICYAYASISLVDLDIVENALVFAQQPRLNADLKKSYNYETASFAIEGACSLLQNKNFSIA